VCICTKRHDLNYKQIVAGLCMNDKTLLSFFLSLALLIPKVQVHVIKKRIVSASE
jgi:hypothetical protein